MIGADLLLALRRLGMSQRDFALENGYREETVSRWVRGHKPIPKIVDNLVSEKLRGVEAVPRGT